VNVSAVTVVLLARKLPRYTLRDGAIFGAAVGFGFAAFESSGYAFNAALTRQGLDLRALVETEILRGLLAPVGHGLWTAILGAVLFRAATGKPGCG
jgi:RsiW-degrading membrane proteinase PrsW (M82 family)